MCDSEKWNYFPSIAVGGAPGDYIARVPVASNQFAEFMVVGIANGATTQANVIISGMTDSLGVDFSGTSLYNDTFQINGQVYRCGTNTTLNPAESWERVANSQGMVWIHVQNAACCIVTIRFRVKILAKIPAPFRTVHPNEEQQYNYMREDRIRQAVLNQEGMAIEYGSEQSQPTGTRKPDEQPDQPELQPAGTGGSAKQLTTASFLRSRSHR